jgi:transposase InsO family protein
MREAGLVGAYPQRRRRKTTVQDPRAAAAPDLVGRQFRAEGPARAVGGGSGAGPHGRGVAVPRGHPGRVASGGGGMGHAPGCPGGVGGGRFGDGAMEAPACPRPSAPLRPGLAVQQPAVWSRAPGSEDPALHGPQGRCLRQRPVRGVLRHAPPGGAQPVPFLRTRDEARSVLFAYLEGFYNRRRHSALGYLSPEEFERRWSANPESVSVTPSTKAG